MTKYEPKAAFEESARLTCGTVPVFNGRAIDNQSSWVVITSDGRIATRDTEDDGHVLVPEIRNIRIVSSRSGSVVAIAPGMEDLVIPYPSCDSDVREPSDDAWAFMGREVSRECTEWVRRFLEAPDVRLVEIDFTLADVEDDYEVGDDLAFFGESDFAAISRGSQVLVHSPARGENAVRDGVYT